MECILRNYLRTFMLEWYKETLILFCGCSYKWIECAITIGTVSIWAVRDSFNWRKWQLATKKRNYELEKCRSKSEIYQYQLETLHMRRRRSSIFRCKKSAVSGQQTGYLRTRWSSTLRLRFRNYERFIKFDCFLPPVQPQLLLVHTTGRSLSH